MVINKGKKWNVFHVNFVLFERLNIKQCLADVKNIQIMQDKVL